MITTRKTWEMKMNALHTRDKGISSEHQVDYAKLLQNVEVGHRVIDIGCGTCWLKKYLTPRTNYTGMDPFATNEQVDCGMVIKAEIDSLDWKDNSGLCRKFNTAFVFAALDGMRDPETAMKNIRQMVTDNIVILTGINIPPDQYHTHLLTLPFIRECMGNWVEKTYIEVMPEKIVFLQYVRPKK